ncbi:comF family protein [Ruminococcaceae bacterium YRB3002]|nr:comF family protein [Ruminococcaceae bacterium YRB3002]
MNIIRDALSVLLPYRCDICGCHADADNKLGAIDRAYEAIYGEKRGWHICSSCLSALIPQDEDRRWFTCLSNPVDEDPYADLVLYMPFSYTGVVDRALPAIKFSGRKGIARLFGMLLGNMMRAADIGADLIVPVPLSPERLEERGYNQAHEIAYPVSRLLGIPLADDVLVRTRHTNRQSDITDAQKRMLNVSGAFAMNDNWDVTGLRVILLDDVATTGHTLREGASVLLDSGAEEVLCCAFSGNRQIKNAEPF